MSDHGAADRPATVNQCDGCARGLPIEDGIHIDGRYLVMGCTKDRYSAADLPVENSELRITPDEALVCWRALDRVPEVEAVERHPAFLSVHAKMEAWARGASRDGTFHCPECGRDTPHTHPVENSELREMLDEYANIAYKNGYQSHFDGHCTYTRPSRSNIEKLFASLQQTALFWHEAHDLRMQDIAKDGAEISRLRAEVARQSNQQ